MESKSWLSLASVHRVPSSSVRGGAGVERRQDPARRAEPCRRHLPRLPWSPPGPGRGQAGLGSSPPWPFGPLSDGQPVHLLRSGDLLAEVLPGWHQGGSGAAVEGEEKGGEEFPAPFVLPGSHTLPSPLPRSPGGLGRVDGQLVDDSLGLADQGHLRETATLESDLSHVLSTEGRQGKWESDRASTSEGKWSCPCPGQWK